jgi:hypothetical protein
VYIQEKNNPLVMITDYAAVQREDPT